jgi:DDE family transposase
VARIAQPSWSWRSPRTASRAQLRALARVRRSVARDRVISTVDTQARHGHKSRNRRFDGYKAHLSVDPDSELIDEITATAGNAPDRDAAADLLGDHARREGKPEMVGDSAYGDAATRAGLEAQGFTVIAKPRTSDYFSAVLGLREVGRSVVSVVKWFGPTGRWADSSHRRNTCL